MNMTDFSINYIENEPLMTVKNCMEYAESVRSTNKTMIFIIILLLILIVVMYFRNKKR